MTAKRYGRRQAGFGLIEMLAAVLVLAIGVIGFAALQMRAVQASGDSYFRTQAMSIAQDLAERARANLSQMAVYTADGNWPPTKVEKVDVTSLDDCEAGTCDAAAMAAFDIVNVRFSAESLLPQGQVRMEKCLNSSLNCIYVAWDGVLPTAGAGGQCVDDKGFYQKPPANLPALPCIMLEVQ